jgi:hypothetical protein
MSHFVLPFTRSATDLDLHTPVREPSHMRDRARNAPVCNFETVFSGSVLGVWMAPRSVPGRSRLLLKGSWWRASIQPAAYSRPAGLGSRKSQSAQCSAGEFLVSIATFFDRSLMNR